MNGKRNTKSSNGTGSFSPLLSLEHEHELLIEMHYVLLFAYIRNHAVASFIITCYDNSTVYTQLTCTQPFFDYVQQDLDDFCIANRKGTIQ